MSIQDDVDPAYTSTCSDVTLCSNPKGFFKSLAEDALDMVTTDWLKEFGDARGDQGKIEAVVNNKELFEALSDVLSRIQPLRREKDAKVSQERRLAAQKALKEGNVTQALALASQAVLKAPMTGELELADAGISLALALWVRSEVLLAAGRPFAAVEDLKMALKEHLPAKMRADYYWRMGHCYKGTGEATRAKVSYELAGRILGNNEEAKTRLAADIRSLVAPSAPPPPQPVREGISITVVAKQNMPALSKLVKIAEEENKGRFAVANMPIKTGDVLLVESPYASCLIPDCFGTHCLHCYSRLENCYKEAPLWCPKCSGVAFCSSQCREVAVSTYHKYECQFLDLYIGSGMSILCYIALRMVTQAGLDASLSIHAKYVSNEMATIEGSAVNNIEGATKKTRMKSRKERLNRAKKGLKSFDKEKEETVEETRIEEKANFEENLELKAAQIYSLCSHSDQRKPEDYLKRIIMAMYLTECLKKSGFFGKSTDEHFDRRERSICELILRNLQLLQFNAHELYETLRGDHQFSGSKAVYVAVGIYPTGALFNHECYPSVARFFDGRKIVLRAVRPIAPGEVVAENYGPHFLVRPLKERQRALCSRYWFRCGCKACIEDWPMLKQMSSDTSIAFKCPNNECSGKIRASPQWPNRCGKCSIAIDKKLMGHNLDIVKQCLNDYQEGAKLMDMEDGKAAIEALCAAVDAYCEVACCPHRETHLAQESLRTCFASFGNEHRVQAKEV